MTTYEPHRQVPAPRSPYEDIYANEGYQNGSSYPSPIPQPVGSMTMYQPPQQSLTVPQQPPYQQNQDAFDAVPKSKPLRRPSTPEPNKLAPMDPRRDKSEPPPQQREKIQTTGGPLAGAASGALIGANLGGQKGKGALGTIGGMVAGAFAGNTLERKFKERRQERQDLQEQVTENSRPDPQQEAQARYDQEYTDVAYAAPGYGSSLLPSDTLHGGRSRRNSRTSSVGSSRERRM